MECFIIEKGVERKAELEDILPMYGIGLQGIFRDTFEYDYLPYALAHLPDETKKLVYINFLQRIRGRLEKKIEDAESKYKKDDSRIQNARAELITFIGKNRRLPPWYSDSVVWKEEKQKEPDSPVEKLIHDIEKACSSGRLRLYDTDKMTEEQVQNAFMAFQDRKDELGKIRTLDIYINDLPAAAILFSAGGIEDMDINGEFNGTWPEFLENYRNLTSIGLNVEGLNEFPEWIRNAVSLRCLTLYKFNGDKLPDWIGDMQSLTEIEICANNSNLKTLPDSICNLKNLAKLSIHGSALEKLPDNIGGLSSLKVLNLYENKNLRFLPDSTGNLKNLAEFSIHSMHNSALEKLPDSIGNLTSLKELSLSGNDKLTYLPDSIGNLQNLVKLSIDFSAFEKLPDSIGGLSSLKELSLGCNFHLISLPDSIGNLKNLTELYLDYSLEEASPDCIWNLQNLTKISLKGDKIESLPDNIGCFVNLTELSLKDCMNLKSLPDGIGNLKNLVKLNLRGSSIDKLPDTIADCTALEYVDIRKTKISSFPDCVSSIKELKRTIEVMPKKSSISYLSFCNYYYTLVETIIRFNNKARRESLMALKDEIYSISDGFFLDGINLVFYALLDDEKIRHILTLKIERERDHYKKKLMEITLEGILCILRGDSKRDLVLRLAAMVDIKNNPLDDACTKYLAGDNDAFDNIDLKTAIQPEGEREEVRFIKRAIEICKMDRNEGIVGIEKSLDKDGITAKDVFEYGISLLVVGLDYKDIDKYLTILIDRETDPARKNFSMAKKDAVRMIHEVFNPVHIKETLLAWFDDEFAREHSSEFDD